MITPILQPPRGRWASTSSWAFASPWIYEYSGDAQRLWNSIILGIVVLALAIWTVSATNTRAPAA